MPCLAGCATSNGAKGRFLQLMERVHALLPTPGAPHRVDLHHFGADEQVLSCIRPQGHVEQYRRIVNRFGDVSCVKKWTFDFSLISSLNSVREFALNSLLVPLWLSLRRNTIHLSPVFLKWLLWQQCSKFVEYPTIAQGKPSSLHPCHLS